MDEVNGLLPPAPVLNCEIDFCASSFGDDRLRTVVGEISGILGRELRWKRAKAFPTEASVSLCRVEGVRDYDLNRVVTEAFSLIEAYLDSLKRVKDAYRLDCVVNIWFDSFGAYPACYLGAENVRKVAFLDGSIGIDIYNYEEENE